MAGSLRWFNYVDDAGATYAIQADESNVKAVNTTAAGALTAGNIYELPKNLVARFAVYSNATRTRTIKVPVLTPTVFAALPATIADPIDSGGTTLSLRYPRAQRFKRLPVVADTGLNDGDSP